MRSLEIARASLIGIVFVMMFARDAMALPGEGWTLRMVSGAWSVVGDLQAPENISGIASIHADTFLIGSDDTKVVQGGKIDRAKKTLTISDTVKLLGKKDDDEIDIEAIAAAPDEGAFYITGSHSVTKSGKMNKERRSVFRLRTNKAGDKFYPKATKRESLKGIIEDDKTLKRYWEKPLQLGGVAIEGLAWRDGKLFFGLRSPNIDDHAIVLETSSSKFFRKGKQRYKLHRVPLGDGLGIRELVPLREGFLIVAGNAGDEPTREHPIPRDFREKRGYFIFFWEPESNRVHQIAVLARTPGRPEAVLVLSDTEKEADLLFLFDGSAGGSPWHYRLTKAPRSSG
jgi:hypothetical protein